MLCECEKGMAVIDAHEARRKCTYEKVFAQLEKPAVMVDLLVPITLHASDDQYQRIEEINRLLKPVSISFEPFGEGTLLIRSIPSWMKDMDPTVFLQDALDSLVEETTGDIVENLKNKVATAASRNTSEKNATLSMEDMRIIVDELSRCQNPYVNLSGKPIVMILDEKQLMKGFAG